jgi:hypothetical protein
MVGESKALEQRLARLENQNRRWKNGAGVLTAIGFACLALGTASVRSRAKLVEATEFRLVDEKGTVRAAISAGRGGASISVNNGAGRTRATLAVGDDGSPRLDLLDRTDAVRASIRLAGDGSPDLVFNDGSKHARGRFRVGPDGSAKIDLADEAQKTRASLSVGADGESRVSLSDAGDQPRAWMAARSDGCPSVKLADGEGSVRASFGCTALKDAASGSSANTEASSLVLFDGKGKVLFKAPR